VWGGSWSSDGLQIAIKKELRMEKAGKPSAVEVGENLSGRRGFAPVVWHTRTARPFLLSKVRGG